MMAHVSLGQSVGVQLAYFFDERYSFFVRYSVLIHLFELFSQRVYPLVSPLHLKIEKNFLSSASKVYTDESNQMVPSHLLRN